MQGREKLRIFLSGMFSEDCIFTEFSEPLCSGAWSLVSGPNCSPGFQVSCFMFQVSSCAAESAAAAGSSARYNVQLSGTKELDSLSSVADGGE